MARRKRILTEEELATIAAFVVPERQERVRLLLARGEDGRQPMVALPAAEAVRDVATPGRLVRRGFARRARAPRATPTATGVIGQLAGQVVPVAHAVQTVFAAQYGDLISLLPGRLAYYDGEWQNGRYLLRLNDRR